MRCVHAYLPFSVASVVFAVVFLAGCGWREARYNRTTASLTGERLRTQFPWLADTSQAWFQEADFASGKVPDYSHLGCFPLGNGRVFTTSGLKYPFGTMSNIFGPTYQKHQGSLGSQSIVLVVGGRPHDLPRQRVDWVLRAGAVHTCLSDANGVKLDLYDCVPPEGHAIVRVVLATNGSRRTVRNAALSLAYSGGALASKNGILASDERGRAVRIGFAGARTTVRDRLLRAALPAAAEKVNGLRAGETGSTVLCPIGSLRPGQSVAKIAYTIIAPGTQGADRERATLDRQPFALLQANHDWWQKWYSDALSIECPDRKITEFVPIEQQIVRVQQAESGGYSPMYMYTTCWVRDSNGPIRFMTQSGKFEEVKRALDYYYRCCALTGTIPQNFPLDLDVSKPLPKVDWRKVPSLRAEVASFLILQHNGYWRQSGDHTPIREHWGDLRRCLLGQAVDAQGRLPFFGDETYRFPGYDIFEQTKKEPTDWVSMDLKSADSAWECVAAAGALCTWAKMLGKSGEAAEYESLAKKVREALDRDFRIDDRGYYAPAVSDFSGEKYRYPFANIDLSPLWLNAGLRWWAPGDDFPLTSALTAIDSLWKGSGTVKTTPGCGYYVGMTPGYVVWNLAAKRHPSLDEGIKGLLAAASPAGEYAEMNKPDDTPSDRYWGKNRARPWEGGINAEALLYALTWLSTDPATHTVVLEPWTVPLSVRNIRCRDSVLSADFARVGEGCEATLRVEGKHSLQVSLLSAEGPVEVKPGKPRTVRLAGPGQMVSTVAPEKAPTKPFDYGPPTFAGKAKTIVVTWSGETYKQYQSAPSPAAIDTKIAFPPEYLAAALYDDKGTRRADRLVLDISLYPGHCKTAEFWTTGEGKKIIDRFKQLGGHVEEYAHPKPKPTDLFGK